MKTPLHRLASLGIGLALVACAAPAASTIPSSTGAPTPSAPAPSGTVVEPSLAPSTSPAATPDEATRPIGFSQNETLATVLVTALNVRVTAGLTAPVLDDRYGVYQANGKVVLAAADHVLVISDPIWADGRWWLEIADDRAGSRVPPIIGFVAAGAPSDPWVKADNGACPGAAPSLGAIAALSGIERLGCYGSTPLSFAAYRTSIPPDAGLGGACDPGPSLPGWLVCDNINHNDVNSDGGHTSQLLLHFDPATGIAPTGLVVDGDPNPLLHIVGHFDDPAAGSCAPSPPVTLDDLAAVLACRTLYVVERIS